MNKSTGNLPAEVADRDRFLHEFNNHLSVIIGFCDLLLTEFPPDNPKHTDIMEIRKSGEALLALLPELSDRLR